MTDDQLDDAIERDNTEHAIKEMGKLFLEAMNDWDTVDLHEIEVFAKKFRFYFGNNLQSIKSKPLDMSNSSRFEASSSIIQMLELSNLNFDDSLQAILKYYTNK
jgi:hypothetical protein